MRKPDHQILFTNNETESNHYILDHAIGYNPDQELKSMVINMQSQSPRDRKGRFWKLNKLWKDL